MQYLVAVVLARRIGSPEASEPDICCYRHQRHSAGGEADRDRRDPRVRRFRVATRAAVRHLKREPLPEKVILPAEIIDKTNYKAWLVPVDQRSCPEWTDVVR